jgi:hypothetical protein
MKQIGIIYKFTIIAKYKFDGHKPFYVGQHFGLDDFDTYPGSGSIWDDFIKRLKQDYPNHWRRFIRREVLYQRPCSQIVLDKMEEYYIKKEKSHYSYKNGGCNILWGTANNFGSGSPMKDPMVRRKQSESLKKTFEKHPELIKVIHEKRQWLLDNTDYKEKISNTLKGRYIGDKNPNYGNKWNKEQRLKLKEKMTGRYNDDKNPNYGNKWSEEKKKEFSNKLKERNHSVGDKNPMFGKVRITNGIINATILKTDKLPEGFWFGMNRK